MPIQLRILKCSEDSHAARLNTGQLLAGVKRAVELAIEQDEAAATEFLSDG